MSTNDAHVGLNLGAIAVISAITAIVISAFKPHWFWVVLAVVCLALWFLAALLISEPKRRDFLAGTLKHSRYTQLYTYLSKSGVSRIWNSVCDPVDDTTSWPTLFRAALTWRLYDKALLFALAYPIWLLMGQWIATGSEARLGSFVVASEAAFWPARAVLLGAFLLLTTGKIAQTLASANPRPGMRKAADWLFFAAFAVASAFAVAFAFEFAVAFASAFAVAFAFEFAVAFAVASAFAVAFAFEFAVAFAVASAFAVAFAVSAMEKRVKGGIARLLLTVGVLMALAIAALMLDWTEVSEDERSIFLFLGVLPIFNALFDVVSYAVTLSLVRRGLISRWPFLWGLLDLGFACVLFLGLGFTLVVAVHGLNLLAGVDFVDLPALFAGIDQTPEAYFWLYLMLFSTIVPTALHGVVSLIGLQGIWPKAWRRKLADRVAAAPESLPNSVLASGLLGVVWAIPVMGVVLVGWLLLWLGMPVIHTLLGLYFETLLWGAEVPIGAI